MGCVGETPQIKMKPARDVLKNLPRTKQQKKEKKKKKKKVRKGCEKLTA